MRAESAVAVPAVQLDLAQSNPIAGGSAHPGSEQSARGAGEMQSLCFTRSASPRCEGRGVRANARPRSMTTGRGGS